MTTVTEREYLKRPALDYRTLYRSVPAMGAVIGVFLLLLHRNSTLFFAPQLWAEDVFIYFNDDRLFGAAAILRQWNGFIQLCCRLIAFAGGMVPAEFAPRIYTSGFVAAILLTAALAYTSPAFRGWGKTLAALALLAAPVSSEIFLGMCYTQWVMGPAVGLAIYERNPSRMRGTILAAAFAMVGFSSPFTILASPWLVWKALQERTTYAMLLVALTVVAGLLHFQNIFGRFVGYDRVGTPIERLSAASSIFYRWLVGAEDPSFIVALIISLVTIGLVAWYAWSVRAVAFRPALYLVSYGAMLIAIGCYTSDATLHPHQFGANGRYFYIPMVLFIWALIIIEQTFARARFSLPAMAAVLAALYATNVNGNAGLFRNLDWGKTVLCLRTEPECQTETNPSFVGPRRIPTDQQIRTFSTDDRVRFGS